MKYLSGNWMLMRMRLRGCLTTHSECGFRWEIRNPIPVYPGPPNTVNLNASVLQLCNSSTFWKGLVLIDKFARFISIRNLFFFFWCCCCIDISRVNGRSVKVKRLYGYFLNSCVSCDKFEYSRPPPPNPHHPICWSYTVINLKFCKYCFRHFSYTTQLTVCIYL